MDAQRIFATIQELIESSRNRGTLQRVRPLNFAQMSACPSGNWVVTVTVLLTHQHCRLHSC